jgi:hypothetical protein
MVVGNLSRQFGVADAANNGRLNVQFLLGVQKAGTFGFYVNVEALP